MLSFAEALECWLADSGDTMSALAARSGVHPTTVLRWKNGSGQPRWTNLIELNAATDGYFAAKGYGIVPAPSPKAEGSRSPSASLAELDIALAQDARALGLDPYAIAAEAIQLAVREATERRWQEENREAYQSQNAWIEKHGLPLAKYRTF